jgi:putative PIN family toxin of toxin-antitoxin system
MIVVLDTNVIISSVLSSKGSPAEIIRRWESDEFEIATSPALLEELERAFSYDRISKRFKEPEERIEALLKGLRAVATLVDPGFNLQVIKDDPDDDRVLECALEAGASYIISGDMHLLRLKEYQGIMVLPPEDFIALLRLGAE